MFGCRSNHSRPPILVQSLPPIGKLSAFPAEWAKIRADQWVLRTLSEGYSLPFSSLPPVTSANFLAPYLNPEKRKALHLAVREMEMKGAIEVVQTPPCFYSRLFRAESRGGGDMEAYNRPLGSELPHPVSVLQDGDQWVSSQSPAKRAMAHHSGFERPLLSYPYPPLLQVVPLVLPPRRGLTISSSCVWVKHCTTSVYNGHSTCRGLCPSQWAQPPRLSRRLAVKPKIGRPSQTANPMVIGSLHSLRLGGKRGEVKLDSSGGQLFGNFARYKSRPCLPLQEEDLMMALHLGGFPG